MSVKNQATYIQLSSDINDLELKRDQLIAQSGDMQAQIDQITKIDLPRYIELLKGWENAGNSDLRNKIAKIEFYRTAIPKLEADRDDLNKQKQAKDFEIRAVKNELTFLYAQREAFENAYRKAIIEGKSTDDASAIAESEKVNVEVNGIPFYKKPMAWVIAVIILAAIVGTIIYVKRK